MVEVCPTMPNLSVLSYCPFRICPYHFPRFRIDSLATGVHIFHIVDMKYDMIQQHTYIGEMSVGSSNRKYMEMLWVKTLKPWCFLANRCKQTTYCKPSHSHLGHPWIIWLWMLQPRDFSGSPARIRTGDPGDRLGGPAQHVPSQAFETVHPPPALCSRTLRWLRNGEVKTWLIHSYWFILIHAITKQHVHQATNLRSFHRKWFNRYVQS